MPAPVRVSVTANDTGFKSTMNAVASDSRKAGAAVQSSMTSASAAMDRAAAASKRLSIAQGQAANAAGRVRIAESQLAAIRAKGNASSIASIRAEENLARAHRRLATAQAEVTASSAAMSKGNFLQRVTDKAPAIDNVSRSLLRIGTVGAAGLGLTAKAAVDWDSAWAGVTKTVNGSDAELASLEGQLRGLARSLPASHTEIAAVAEAAGQLGIATPTVSAFTKTMIDLGETTNLTADDAATSIAQFTNIMGTLRDVAPDEANNRISRLAATIVGLGNSGASTERDIVGMGLRISGAGKTIGLTETQVLGFASALSSVGIEVEAGGTAISQSFLKMDQQVRRGGKGLDLLAKTAGMSAAEFKHAFETDASGAVTAFVEGLGRVQAAGGDTTSILTDLGITGMRQTDALRRLANAGSLLSDTLKQSNAEYQRGDAAINEANKRYATSASQIRIAWNQISDAAIDAGQASLPIIAALAQGVGAAAGAFRGLSPDAQTAVVAIGGVATAAALIGGVGLKAATSIAELAASASELGVIGPRAAGALTAIGKAAGVAAAAVAGFMIVGSASNALISGSLVSSVEDTTRSLLELAKTSDTKSLDGLFQSAPTALKRSNQLVEGVSDVESALNRMFNKSWEQQFNDFGSSLFEWTGATSVMQTLKKSTDALDLSLTNMAGSGASKEAAAGFNQIRAAAERQHVSVDQLLTLFPKYKASLEQQANALKVTSLTAGDYADWMGGKVPAAIQKAMQASGQNTKKLAEDAAAYGAVASALQDLATPMALSLTQSNNMAASLFAQGNAAQQVTNSHMGYAEALDQANEVLKRNEEYTNKSGTALSDNSAKGRENIAVLSNLASNGKAWVQSLVAQGGSAKQAADATREVRGEFIKAARDAGLNKDAAKELADSYGLVPSEVRTDIKLFNDAIAQAKVKAFTTALEKLPPEQQTRIMTIYDEKGGKAALKELERLQRANLKIPVNVQVSDALGKIGMAKRAFDALPEETRSRIEALFEKGKTDEAMKILEDLNQFIAKPSVDVLVDDALTAIGKTRAQFETLPEKTQTKVEALIEQGKIAEAKELLNSLALMKIQPPVSPKVDTSAKQRAEAELTTLTEPQSKEIGTRVSGVPQATGAFQVLTEPVEKVVTVRPEGIDSTQNQINSIRGVDREADISPTGVGSTQRSFNSIRGVDREARLTATGVDSSQRKINSVNGVSREVQVRASGVDSTQAQIYDIRGKTVYIDVVKRGSAAVADGGVPVEHPGYDRGHVVTGFGGPREDNIAGIDRKSKKQTSWVSVGEMVTNKRSTDRNRGPLEIINANPDVSFGLVRLAAGGIPGYAFGSSDTAALMRLIAKGQDPLRSLSVLQAALAKAQRPVAGPLARRDRAVRAYDAAVEKRDDIKERIIGLQKAAAATKGNTKADRELAAARRQLARQNLVVSRTSREKTKATVDYNKVAKAAKERSDALKAAQNALADSARQVATSFRDQYKMTATDGLMWIDNMRQGATEIATFTRQVAALRKQGLSETLIQQILGMGAREGSATATSILAGGKGMIAQLNKVNNSLQVATDKLGFFAATGKGRVSAFAGGGPVRTGSYGYAADDVHGMLSRDEWVIQRAAARLYGDGAMNAINAGRVPPSVLAPYGGRAVVDKQWARPSADYSRTYGDRNLNFNGDFRGTTAREVAREVLAMMDQREALSVAAGGWGN